MENKYFLTFIEKKSIFTLFCIHVCFIATAIYFVIKKREISDFCKKQTIGKEEREREGESKLSKNTETYEMKDREGRWRWVVDGHRELATVQDTSIWVNQCYARLSVHVCYIRWVGIIYEQYTLTNMQARVYRVNWWMQELSVLCTPYLIAFSAISRTYMCKIVPIIQ